MKTIANCAPSKLSCSKAMACLLLYKNKVIKESSFTIQLENLLKISNHVLRVQITQNTFPSSLHKVCEKLFQL